LAGLWSPLRVCGQAVEASQPDIEAVYLYNFAKFVRWPGAISGPSLDICVAGQKVYLDTLSRIVAGEHVNERSVSVRAIQRPEDVAGCNILFVGQSAKAHLDSLLTAAADKSVLTVSDIPGFLDRGGMIQFMLVDNRVRFSVDLRPSARHGITFSSELLKVAIAVNGQPGDGGAK
jgi:hypothetical protein